MDSLFGSVSDEAGTNVIYSPFSFVTVKDWGRFVFKFFHTLRLEQHRTRSTSCLVPIQKKIE